MVEGVHPGEGPSEAGESPSEHHDEPAEHVEVESDVRGASEDSPEGHGVPVGVHTVHVLTLVDVEVIQDIEAGESTVDGPSEVSSHVHSLLLGLLGSSAFVVCVADK